MEEKLQQGGRPSLPSGGLKPVSWRKILEVAIWGAAIWGLVRLAAAYFNFTPYGVRVFARPWDGLWSFNTRQSQLLGIVVLFAASVVASALYAFLLSRFRQPWVGLAYGLALFLLFAALLSGWNWKADTVSTELAWFLSYGLFVGMSLTADRYGET